MTLGEIACWGQNNGGIGAYEAPKYILESKNKKEIEEFIKGIYCCQDAGPVPLFQAKSFNFCANIMYILDKIGIDSFIHNNVVCPSTVHDATILQMLLETAYKGRVYNQ